MPGTVPVGTWEGAQQARAALAVLPAGGQVTVIGGSLTGIETAAETAAEIAEARPDLRARLVGSSVGGDLSADAYRRLRAGLERLTVEIVDDVVTDIGSGAGQLDGVVRLRSGVDLVSDLTLWAIVADVPDLRPPAQRPQAEAALLPVLEPWHLPRPQGRDHPVHPRRRHRPAGLPSRTQRGRAQGNGGPQRVLHHPRRVSSF